MSCLVIVYLINALSSLVLDFGPLDEVLANPGLLEDHGQEVLRFDVNMLSTLILTLSDMAWPLLDLIIHNIAELLAEQQALLQILCRLHIQEIVNSEINEILVGDHEQALSVLQSLATLINCWKQRVVSDHLVLEGHVFGEFDLGQHSVYDGHVFIVDSDLTFQINSSRGSSSVEFHIQLLKLGLSDVADVICCSRNTLAHRLSSSQNSCDR